MREINNVDLNTLGLGDPDAFLKTNSRRNKGCHAIWTSVSGNGSMRFIVPPITLPR